jgi:hypothetical protein
MRSSLFVSVECAHISLKVTEEVKREVKKRMGDVCRKGGNGHK